MKNSFSVKLRELRGSKSQSEFANEIGAKQTTYSSWERGIKEPNLDMVCDISTRFGVSADWLLGLPSRGGGNATASAPHAIAATGHARVTTGSDCSKCKLMQAHIKEITGR